MNRILTSTLVITVVLGFVANGVWAYNFDGVGSVSDSIIGSGNTVNIVVNGQNPWSQSYAVGPAEPGYTGHINLSVRNIGGSDADLYLKLYNVLDSDIIRSDSEYKAEKLIGEKHDISKQIRVGVYNGLNNRDNGILKDIAGKSINIGKIDIGDTVYIDIAFHLEEDTGNEYQGDQSKFDISLSGITSDSPDDTEKAYVGGSDDTDSCHGVVTPEHLDNVVMSETHDRNLVSDIPIYYDYSSDKNDIYRIRATDKSNEKCISMRTEILINTSGTVKEAAPGNVYRNINVWSGTDNIKEYDIAFKVEKAWSEKYSPGNVRLFRWNKSGWEELDTKIINKDDKYYYFESHTSSYGAFAITGTRNDVGIGDMDTPTFRQTLNSSDADVSTSQQTLNSSDTDVSMFQQMLNSILQIMKVKMKYIYHVICEEC